MRTVTSITLHPDDRIQHQRALDPAAGWLEFTAAGDDEVDPGQRLYIPDLETASRLVAAATDLRDALARQYIPAVDLEVGMWIVMPHDTEASVVRTVTPRADGSNVLVRTNAGICEFATDRPVRRVGRPQLFHQRGEDIVELSEVTR